MSTSYESDPSEDEVQSKHTPSPPEIPAFEMIRRAMSKGKEKAEEGCGSRPSGPGVARARAMMETTITQLQQENAQLVQDVRIGESVISDLNEKWQDLDQRCEELSHVIRMDKKILREVKAEKVAAVDALVMETGKHGQTQQRFMQLKMKYVAMKKKHQAYKAKVQKELADAQARAEMMAGQMQDDLAHAQTELHSDDDMSDASGDSVQMWW